MRRTHFLKFASTALAVLAFAFSAQRVAAQANGSIDTAFGTRNNWAVFDVTNGDVDVTGEVTHVMSLPNGKVVAAGECILNVTSSPAHACLYRWTASGVLDTSFGFAGVSLVFQRLPSTLGDGEVVALHRPNGSFFVASSCLHPSFGSGICVAAVRANGNGFDSSFGGTGQTFLPLPSGYTVAAVQSIILQPDGNLLVGATCRGAAPARAGCVARLTPAAIFDTTFGVNNWSITNPGGASELYKLVLLPDGRYFALASCWETLSITERRLCAELFSANGAFQRTLVTDVANRYEVLLDARVLGSHLSLQWRANGAAGSPERIYAARREAYSVNGTYDTSFGGYPSTGVAGDFNIDSSDDGDANVGGILSDGSFLYVGTCNSTSILSSVMCSTRLAPNGTLDASYGVGGRFEYGGQLGPWGDRVRFSLDDPNLAETSDGKVLVPGYCSDGISARPCVIRLNGSPQTARACTMDIDGDGVINATTDGLILLRAMLGFSGATALTNAVGAGASRSTWPQVREYLFDQCRMPVPIS